MIQSIAHDHYFCFADQVKNLSILLWNWYVLVQVFHFVAWRKQGMQVVYEAYMKKGLMCAYHVFASLPHLEKQYDDGSWLAKTNAVMKSC